MKRTLIIASLVLCACNQTNAPKKATHPPIDPSTVVALGPDTFSEGFDGGVQGPNGSNWWVNEMPSHDVTLSAFTIDASEVTVSKYATFLAMAGGVGHWAASMPISVGATTQDFTAVPGTESVAMYDVTWFDARAYCLWMGGDLPTEAQWEYAAKNTNIGQIYPWGTSGPACDQANFFTGDVTCELGPIDAGSYSPAGDTPQGIHDLAGNVAEWTFDVYSAYTTDAEMDPSGPDADVYGDAAATELRVIRGGGYRDVPISLRTTNRYGADAALRSKGVGFRCAYGS